MARKLKITMTDGGYHEYVITPSMEYAFEQHFKKGFFKAFREEEMQSMVYWLAWEALRRGEQSPKPFGESFLDTLALVDVDDEDSKS